MRRSIAESLRPRGGAGRARVPRHVEKVHIAARWPRARVALRTSLVVAALACAAVLACGSNGSNAEGGASEPPAATPPDGPGGPGAPGSTSESGTSPPERRELPLATPSLGGFTLVDAFPSVAVDLPMALVWPKVDGAVPFVLERAGRVVQIAGGAARPVLDFSSSVHMISESGALGMALHPMFGDGSGSRPYVFVWYNAIGQTQRLSRFTWSAATSSFDRASETIFVEEAEERPEHNAGHIQFGPDGFLYFGNGDDINEANHQRLDRALFAGIFRIDVDAIGGAVSHPPPRQPAGGYSARYFIPNDNPFVGVPSALEEFFALGFRNPFGFSLDRGTGALLVADVGDTFREEVDVVVSGGNYEWPYREGDVVRGTTPPTIGTSYVPRYTYSHAEMGDLTAILGGYVYRGKAVSELTGRYIYSDWPSCRIWALDLTTDVPKRTTLIDNQWTCVPMALAEDNQGELYVLRADGISRLARDTNGAKVPMTLSATTLFADVTTLTPDPALVPYVVSSPLWSDGAVKQRWIRLPQGKRVDVAGDGTLVFPVGTTFVKHFELPLPAVPHARTRRLETRVLVVGAETIYGLTYRWNAQGTDAELVLEPADEAIVDDTSHETQTWHFPSFGQCWSCHRPENRVLGFTAGQLALVRPDGKEQLAVLAALGVFDPAAVADLPPGLARPSDGTASLDARATAYLAANCSPCHHQGASYLGGGPTWRAEPGVALADRGLVGAPHHNYPMASALGLPAAPLVDPGNPDGSILLARVKSNAPDLRMPPLARNVVDVDGAQLLDQWIRALPKAGP